MRHFTACIVLCVAMPVASAAHLRWQTQAGVVDAGFRGAVIADIDGDGSNEAVFTAGYSSVASSLGVIASKGNGLVLEHMLHFDAVPSSPIVAASVGERAHIFAGVDIMYSTHALIEFGGRPLRELRRIPTAQWVRPLDVADLDADGDLEVLALVAPYSYHDAQVAVIDYATGATLWTDTFHATGAIAMQLDADPALEIVVAGAVGRVLDGSTRLQEWSYPAGFRSQLLSGEFDIASPGREFAATDTSGSPLTIFRSNPYSPLREAPLDSSDQARAVVDDLDNNGHDEVVVAGPWFDSGIFAYTPATESTRRYSQVDFYPDGVASGDLAGSPAAELVLTSLQGWNHLDSIRVVDSATNVSRLSVPRAAGPYAPLAVGDVDGDGRDEVVHVLSQLVETPGHARLFCTLDASTGERQACLAQEGYVDPPRVAPILGQFGIAAGTDIVIVKGGVVSAFDGATFTTLWQRSDITVNYLDVASAAAMRFNADAIEDVVLLDQIGRLHVLDGLDGATLWHSVAVGEGNGSGELTLTLANVDADPAIELLVTTRTALYAFDSQTRLLDWSLESGDEIGRLVQWGAGADCHIGLYGPTGTFQAYRCSDRTAAGGKRSFPVNANMLRPLDAFGTHFVAATAGSILSIAPNDSVRTWATGLGTRLGDSNAGVVLPLGGSRYDLIIGSDASITRVAIHLDLVFEDTFEQ